MCVRVCALQRSWDMSCNMYAKDACDLCARRRRPNARSVLTALRKVKDLPYTTIATGHGPMLRLNVEELVQRWVALTYLLWKRTFCVLWQLDRLLLLLSVFFILSVRLC